MPHFNCTFIDERGRLSRRVLIADSREQLLRSGSQGEHKLIRVRRRRNPAALLPWIRRSGRFSGSDFLLFNQQLIALLKSGLSFLRSLETIIENTPKPQVREILAEAAERIRSGEPVSRAFSGSSIPFADIYRASLLAGENSGQLEAVLERFNHYLGKVSGLRRKVFSSLAYPVVLLIFMTAMILVVMLYVIPRFSGFYTDMDAQLPLITTLFTSVGQFLQKQLPLIVGLLAGVWLLLTFIARKNRDFTWTSALKLRLPFTGMLMLENALVVFIRTLTILLRGGIPVPEAAAVAVETFDNRHLRAAFRGLPDKIRSGMQLSQAMQGMPLVPGILIEMIKVGETSGNLVRSLDESAEYYESTIDSRISTLISLIEPVIIIFMGLVIAFMLLSVYLPIFSIIRVIQ